MTNPLERKIDDYLQGSVNEGGRNQELFKAAALFKDLGNSENEANNILGMKASRDGLSNSEIRNTIRSAFDRPIDPQISEFRHHENEHSPGKFIGWDDDIGGMKTPPKRQVEAYKADIPPPSSDWEQSDFKRFLDSAFDSGEIVNVVPEVRELKGKLIPAGRGINATFEQLQTATSKQIVQHDQGAWIRINPTDGQGIADKNVTSFRHALVESDTLELGKQLAIYRELQLPVSGIIHSGGKSLHAWV